MVAEYFAAAVVNDVDDASSVCFILSTAVYPRNTDGDAPDFPKSY